VGFVATSPGKVVVLGEYAVLAGAPALVLAVDRYCRAEIGVGEALTCRLRTWAPHAREFSFPVGVPSGVELVDTVLGRSPAGPVRPWCGVLDSRELCAGESKLGLGSSAAALTAWAAVWAAYSGSGAVTRDAAGLKMLIDLHRALQGGTGSGLDVAASLIGGAIRYRLRPASAPEVGSVRLLNSVGFACIFTGHAASTPGLLARFNAWRAGAPEAATEQLRHLGDLSTAGCAAIEAADADGFLRAVAEYGQRLEQLGTSMGADVVTSQHRDIGTSARDHGVVYKVSGAGGGDLGLAFSADLDALGAFKKTVSQQYKVIDLGVDRRGLTVEERAG